MENEIVNVGKGYVINTSPKQNLIDAKYWKFFTSVEDLWEYYASGKIKVPYYLASPVEYIEDLNLIKLHNLKKYNDLEYIQKTF